MGDDGVAGGGYRGVIGAFPYAWRTSVSWGFRAYVVVAAIIVIGVTVVIAGGVMQLLASAGRSGGVGAFVRAFYILVGAAIVVPVVVPVLVVARRHRMGGRVSRGTERVLAGAGVAFILSVYLGLVASTPPANQEQLTGWVGVVAAWLYGLPRFMGVVAPIIGATVVYLAVRRTREA